MSITHIPFYPSDWLAGTRGMMADETGVYITLIARMYEMAAPIERDDERLYRICGCKSKRAFVKIVEFLIHEGKIQEANGELFQQRVAKEINKVVEKSSKAKAAARERWDKKPNNNNDSQDADAMQTHMPETCQPEPEPKPYKNDAKASTKKRAARLPDDWVLPKDYGDWALGEGFSREQIRLEADKFKDYWISLGGQRAAKINWLATWRNWIRNNQPHGGSNGTGFNGRKSGPGHSIADIAMRNYLEDEDGHDVPENRPEEETGWLLGVDE